MTTVLLYDHAAAPLRLEFPSSWPDAVAAVNIGIADTRGTVLLAPAAATVWAGTTLAANAAAGDTTVTLTGVAGLVRGDTLRVYTATVPAEDFTVKSITGTVVTLSRALLYDHTAGASVVGRFATATVDTTVTDTWSIALRAIITWTPDTATPVITDEAIVRPAALALAGLRERFVVVYPDEYRAIEARGPDGWDKLEGEARRRVEARLLSTGRFLDALKRQISIEPIMMDTIRLLVMVSSGSKWTNQIPTVERMLAAAWEDFNRHAEWYDDNHDGVEQSRELKAAAPWNPIGRSW